MYREGWQERVAHAMELRMTLLERGREAAKKRLRAHRAGVLETLVRLEKLDATPTLETLDVLSTACDEAGTALERFASPDALPPSTHDFLLLEANLDALRAWPMEAAELVVGSGLVTMHGKTALATALRDSAVKLIADHEGEVHAISRLDGLHLYFHRDVDSDSIPFRLDVRVALDDQGTAYVTSSLHCPVRWTKRARIRPQTMGDDVFAFFLRHEPQFDHETFDVTFFVEGDEPMLREMLGRPMRDALLAATKTDVVDVIFEAGVASTAVGDVRTVASACALLGRFAVA